MAEQSNQKSTQQPNGDCPAEGYTPASFEKRAAAWMGIAYVLMILFVINFAIYTGGCPAPSPCFWCPCPSPWPWCSCGG